MYAGQFDTVYDTKQPFWMQNQRDLPKLFLLQSGIKALQDKRSPSSTVRKVFTQILGTIELISRTFCTITVTSAVVEVVTQTEHRTELITAALNTACIITPALSRFKERMG